MRVCVLAVLLTCVVCSLPAQETRGMISGRVTDPQSAAVVGAGVTVTNVGTNVSTRLTTNSSGYYEAPLLVAGDYEVTVEAPGFKKFVRSGLTLTMSGQLSINLQLEVGALADSVTVTAEAPILDTSTVTTGKVVSTRELMDLPVLTNNTAMFARTAPGVVVQDTTQYLSLGYSGGSSGFSMPLGVSRNEWMIDGMPNSTSGSVGFTPFTEMVAEYKVETSNFDASFGHGSGLNVSFASKSGSNQLHGSASEMYWNSIWNADGFFIKQSYWRQIAQARAAGNSALADALASKPAGGPGHSNVYGATLTGPIYIPKVFDGRNRLFFYFAFSGTNDRQPARINEINFTVPTDANRRGDFSDLLFVNSKYQVYDPLSVRPDPSRPTHYVRTPFSGNVLPPSRIINPVNGFYNKRLPSPNNNPLDPKMEPTLNYRALWTTEDTDYNALQNRIDYQHSDKHRFFFRWELSQLYDNAADWTRQMDPGFHAWDDYRKPKSGVVDWTYAKSGSTVLNASIGANQYFGRQFHVKYMSYKPTDLGLPKYMDDKCATTIGCAVPGVNWSGYVGTVYSDMMSYSVSSWPVQRSYTLKLNFSHIRGDHTFRAGFDYRQAYRTDRGAGGYTSGLFNYANNYTRKDEDGLAAAGTMGLSWASFLMGIPASMSIDTNGSYALMTPYYGWYVQDTWRVTRHLTVTPGFRIEYEQGPTERYNRAVTYFDPNATLPIAGAAVAAYAKSPLSEVSASSFLVKGGPLYAGVGNTPRSFWQGELMLLPRLSAAWQFSPRMVLRGGYGIYFDSIDASINQYGYSRTTSTTLTNDFGQTWNFPANASPTNGNSPLLDPFPVRSDGTRFDVPYGNALGTTAYLGQSFSDTPYERKHQRMQRWRIGVQRQLSANMVVEAAYWGQFADRLGVRRNLQALPGKYWATGMVRNNAVASDLNSNVTNPFYIGNFASVATSNPLLYQQMSTSSFFTSPTIQKNRLLRAYPQMSGLTSPLYDGKARSHALEISFERRLSRGFNLSASYTRGMGENWTTMVNEFDSGPTMWLPSDSPRPHRFIATGIYELPFGKGRQFLNGGILRYLVGGWQAALTFEWQPGPALSWGNYFYYGDFSTLPEDLTKGTKTLERWFNTDIPIEKSSSKNPAAYHVRVFPLDITSVRGDSVRVWNGNLRRTFQLIERVRLELRMDALNLQNRSQMSNPSTDPTSTDFGRITSQSQSVNRFYQAQVRIQF